MTSADRYQEIAELLERIRAAKLLDAQGYTHHAQIAASFHSTAIEGSTLTLPETQVLLESGVVAAGKPMLHHEMVQDLHDAAIWVWTEAAKRQPLSVQLLQQLNALVLRRTGSTVEHALGRVDTTTGAYRLGSVTAAGKHTYPDAKKIPARMEQLVQELNTGMTAADNVGQQVALAHYAHFALVQLHPWYDGNGRTSRLLQNWVELHFNLPTMQVEIQHRAGYIGVLQAAQQLSIIAPFLDWMAGMYRQQLEEMLLKHEQRNRKGKGLAMVWATLGL